jgi:hypothetical protein
VIHDAGASFCEGQAGGEERRIDSQRRLPATSWWTSSSLSTGRLSSSLAQPSPAMDGDIDRSRALVRSYVAYRPTNSPLTIAAPSLQGTPSPPYRTPSRITPHGPDRVLTKDKSQSLKNSIGLSPDGSFGVAQLIKSSPDKEWTDCLSGTDHAGATTQKLRGHQAELAHDVETGISGHIARTIASDESTSPR